MAPPHLVAPGDPAKDDTTKELLTLATRMLDYLGTLHPFRGPDDLARLLARCEEELFTLEERVHTHRPARVRFDAEAVARFDRTEQYCTPSGAAATVSDGAPVYESDAARRPVSLTVLVGVLHRARIAVVIESAPPANTTRPVIVATTLIWVVEVDRPSSDHVHGRLKALNPPRCSHPASAPLSRPPRT
jgi:hypothetical protein